jgi:hypothetical protein
MVIISKLNRLLNQKRALTKDEIKFILEFEENQKRYNLLKKEYNKLRDKQKLSERLKIFIFLSAINFADNEVIKTLLGSVQKSKLPKAKVALARLYFRTNNFIKSIQLYSQVFDTSYNSFHTKDVKYYLLALKRMAQFNRYEQVLEILLKKYPKDRSLQIEALIYQVSTLHRNPQNINHIRNNINYIVKNIKSYSEFFTLGHVYYNAGFLKQSFYAYDLFYRHLRVENTKKKFKNDLKVSNVKKSLHEILDIVKAEGHKGFLIGGTLLGFIRDGDILEHDKDADIGLFIDDYETIYKLVSKICETPHFISPYMVEKPKEFLRKNIAIYDTKRRVVTDLFFFRKFKEGMVEHGIWTTHSTLKWVFREFKPIEREFNGYKYYIPQEPERYLEELFGNWRKPVKVWDSLINCPNLTQDSKNAVIYYALQRLSGAVEERNLVKFENYLNGLKKWGFEFSKETQKNIEKIKEDLKAKEV